MPLFYFHLSATDEDFRDEIGCELVDLSAAHFRAVKLADRVMMLSAFSNCAPDFRLDGKSDRLQEKHGSHGDIPQFVQRP